MSLAEYYMENAWQITESANARALQDCLDNAPEPQDDPGWAALCRDPQWNFKVPQSDEDIPILFYSETLASCDPKDHWGRKCPIKAVPVPTTTPAMHRGALAPRWVLETMPASNADDDDDTLESYQRRLMCAVTGRFVLIERADARGSETLVASAGRPTPGVRYRWRYW